MTVLITKTLLRHLRDRLRANYVDEGLYDDNDLLALLSDAYRDACEQSRCLQALHDFTLTGGTAEYDVPADFSQAIQCWSGGILLEPSTLARAFMFGATSSVPFAYYQYGTKIGLSPTPAGGETVTMLYAQRPSVFNTYDDELDRRFPEEYSDLLVHYVRWRVQMLSGGAERIAQARFDRNTYDFRVDQLRRYSQMIDGTTQPSFGSVAERDARARGSVRA